MPTLISLPALLSLGRKGMRGVPENEQVCWTQGQFCAFRLPYYLLRLQT